MFHDQRVDFGRFMGTETSCSKPDMCIINNANGKAFIAEVANPFDQSIYMCYQQKFEKCMPLCLVLISAGFHIKIIVFIIGSLRVVHRKIVSGLHNYSVWYS